MFLAKKIIIRSILLLMLTGFWGLTSHAQTNEASGLQFSVNTGIAVPIAPDNFVDSWNIGPGVGAGVEYQLDKTLSLQLYGSYHRFGFDKEGFRDFQNLDSNVSVDGGSAEIGTVMGNVIFHYATVDPTITPYFKIGGGFFRSVRSDIDFESGEAEATLYSDSEATFGANSAVGVNYLLGKTTTLFFEVKYTTAFFEGGRTQYLPINIGLTF